ncbi:uncharacterized protein YdeI (YjbR/CyaY-like superfamily) [Mucilaginibacter gracilis]|uniref:Uncharacterized protein YdeI (YjbR/CyaY-like superfamily) n=1 Tax=Mucilaginibacter gracilis TaxID=423350 RepID=A0A495ITE2_9SPHI|nr:YdeI/OmpD-associated family protein [Mucilaginibacter gracilis]RKR80027.1 uncharacterized protein YdeI (YjbR/CyaY-like superfamily) [Mucilaginibacter gracilis]
MEPFDPRVDAYIAKSADFAKPILNHIRNIVHKARPGITETIKWGMPFFDYQGTVCQMAAFKQHCGFGFWKASRLSDPHQVLNNGEEASAGSFGRIYSLSDLPADDILIAYIQEAIQLNTNGEKGGMKIKQEKPATAIKKEIPVPEEFLTALDANPAADEHFSKFSPSKQREYLEWFADTKSEATRSKRIATAIEWIAEGKSRHWKYHS